MSRRPPVDLPAEAKPFTTPVSSLVDWLRMEAGMKLAHYETMRESTDPDRARCSTGYLAAARWMEHAATRMEAMEAALLEGARRLEPSDPGETRAIRDPSKFWLLFAVALPDVDLDAQPE